MRGAHPMVMAVALGTVVAVTAVGPEPVRPPAPERGPDQVLRNMAFEPPSYRLSYTSLDRPALFAAVPGRPSSPALGGSAGDADLDPDARTGTLVWVSRRAPDNPQQPDSAHLDGDLFLQRSGGAVTRLTRDTNVDRNPALSPDGRRVAFTSDRGGSDDIWVLEVASRTVRRITDHPAIDSAPTWSPDGRRIAFSSTRDDPAGDIYSVSSSGGRATRLTTDPAADTEPAWSPDGQRIAFTTTRFRPVTGPGTGAGTGDGAPVTQPADVVTMPAAGGAVTRAVPAPLDSAQPAWAPDSRRLAFVSVGVDPAGDVYSVDRGVVTPVATNAARAETAPTWRGSQVVYTAVDMAPFTDVWSADANGGDHRDLTARPRVNESGAAYTADGFRLAYSTEQIDGGERIVVADADGRNARVLAPPGTQPGDRDSDPVWSPDGSMLAFSRYHPGDPESGGEGGEGPIDLEAPRAVDGQPPSRVLVVRVADGALVGELPVPAHLDGDDEQPSWSPDGTRLAVARMAAEHFSRVDPPRVDRPLRPNEQFDQPTTVLSPEIPASPEIVFFLDSTASMARTIDGLKTTIVNIIRRVQQSQPNARFALVAFGAHEPTEIAAGRYYRRLSDLVGGADADDQLAAALAPLQALMGGDEGWYNAIVQAFGGADAQRVHLRPGSSPIAVLIGDSPSTGNTRFPPGGEVPEVTQQEVIDLLNSDAVQGKLVAVPVVGTNERGLDWDDNDPDNNGEATEIATATRGVVTATTRDDEVAEAVVTGLTNTRVIVRPTVERCDAGVGVTFDPAQREIISGQRASFTVRPKLTTTAPPGSVLTCSVLFDVGSAVPLDEVRQQITVRVSAADRPFVRVDDVTVQATGPQGARVDYTASAVNPLGLPLPAPVCVPPSGSVFPVGQTLVTCTSAAGGGQPGQDVAMITVTDPAATARRIWVTDIKQVTTDRVTFGDQRDLSARVGAPCRPRGGNAEGNSGDRAPAWSPDGTDLAFIDSAGDRPNLCVVDPDGTNPRTPVLPAEVTGRGLADPAWQPDGTRIAVARYDTQSVPMVLTVPSGGGPATVAVRTAGGASEPAYRMLPGRDLTVTASVAKQPAYVGGDAIPVTFTVRNTSPRPATNVFLSPTVPVELTRPAQVDKRCDADATVCRLGELGINAQTTITVMLPAKEAVTTAVAGRVTATVGDRAPINRLASVPVVVQQPTLAVDPPIGPPGFVTRAVGAGYPPGSVVRLTWTLGVTAKPDTVQVQPDGTFDVQVLVLRKDPLGPRSLVASSVSGIRFGAVPTSQSFLVVPRQAGPPLFAGRN